MGGNLLQNRQFAGAAKSLPCSPQKKVKMKFGPYLILASRSTITPRVGTGLAKGSRVHPFRLMVFSLQLTSRVFPSHRIRRKSYVPPAQVGVKEVHASLREE